MSCSIGEMVDSLVGEMNRLLKADGNASLGFVEQQEQAINQGYQEIEEKCLDLLSDKETLAVRDVRMLVLSTTIAAKFERMADHANRVARIAYWARQDAIDIPCELPDMAQVVHHMIRDVLLSFLTDSPDKTHEILNRDNEVDYLDDLLLKKLLTGLQDQDQAHAQMRAAVSCSAQGLSSEWVICAPPLPSAPITLPPVNEFRRARLALHSYCAAQEELTCR